jgi:MOSC domain-containing protein YiiM
MELVSVNVGLPRTVEWRGKPVETGIFKQSVSEPVFVRTLNIDGDRQADLTVHGGAEKAVYGYPAGHYQYWQDQLGESLAWGAFGENLTMSDVDENTLHIGDHLRIGSVELVVTQPRLPCFKLGIRFSRPDMVRRFLESRRTGFYFAVVQEGFIETGNTVEVIARDPLQVCVADITRLYAFEKQDTATMRRVVKVQALAEGWREYFTEQLAQQGA